MQQAKDVATELSATLPLGLYATDWTRQNSTWFAAVQVEKRMMGIILFLIVLVGAFGLVSTLVMTVTEKQADIAILRTLGATPRSIMTVFMIQGAVVGFIGVSLGVALGLGIACNLDVIVPAIEAVTGTQFLPKEIYYISQMPSDPRASDIIPIAVFSFLMSLAATIYPSWRASRIRPAEALRYE
jgi:lipoprotein-releasing system permease protein